MAIGLGELCCNSGELGRTSRPSHGWRCRALAMLLAGRPSPTPPSAAMCCCCRPATMPSAGRLPWRRASWCWRSLRPKLLERLSRAQLRARRRSARPADCRQACCPSLFLAMLVAAGFLGSRDPLSNPLPLTVWTLLWVGLTLVQGLFGNLWAWINPWYGPWRAVLALARPLAGGPAADRAAGMARPLAGGSALLRLRLVRAGLSGAGRSGAPGPASSAPTGASASPP